MDLPSVSAVTGHHQQIPIDVFRSQPWRVHDLIPDFGIEDVWLLPTPSGSDGLIRFVQRFTDDDDRDLSPVVRALMALRWKVGGLFGWDRPDQGVGGAIASLRDRLPEDLRVQRGPDLRSVPMTSVYLTDREWLCELGNRTVHGLMHISWVPIEDGTYRGQMAVITKPNGLLGTIYMALIKPIRLWIVYPAMLRGLEKNWRES